jgi:hypothetical protein
MLDSAKKEYNQKPMGRYFSEISKWEISLIMVSEEINFLGNLLRTEIFEPNIPNLYERLQQYSTKLQDLKNKKTLLEKEIEKHKTCFAKGLMGNEEQMDSLIKKTNIQLKKNIKSILKNNSELKLEIFNYTGNILKKSG